MKQFWFKFFVNGGWIVVCFFLQGCSFFQFEENSATDKKENAVVGSVEMDESDMPPVQPPVRYEPKRPEMVPEPMPMQLMMSEVRPFQENEYHVQRGDTLSSIAEKFNVGLVALLQANNLGLHEKIYVDQRIVIPSTKNSLALYKSRSSHGSKPSKANGDTTYRVKRGDTLEAIARKFHVSTNHLAKVNQLKNKNLLSIGQRLTIPGNVLSKEGATKQANASGEYRVKHGDTLFGIAKRYKMRVSDLRQLNHLKSDCIRVGQILVVANGGKSGASTKEQKVVESPSTLEVPSTESTVSTSDQVESKPPAQPVESSDSTLSMTPEDQAWLEEGTFPVVPLEEVN